jgi:hypothetical protein
LESALNFFSRHLRCESKREMASPVEEAVEAESDGQDSRGSDVDQLAEELGRLEISSLEIGHEQL